MRAGRVDSSCPISAVDSMGRRNTRPKSTYRASMAKSRSRALIQTDAPLTPGIARQLCGRTGSAAVLDGSIAKLGTQYVLGLKAVSCSSGESLAEVQLTANGKEEVLKALVNATTNLRIKLGESLGTVEKFNAPIEQVTTPSLEALQYYSLGRSMIIKQDEVAAVPFFQRAVSLDPNFAMAYASLGVVYYSYSEKDSLGYFRRAYELRERVGERERFYIEAHYYTYVTPDLEKSRRANEAWAQTYPRDDVPLLQPEWRDLPATCGIQQGPGTSKRPLASSAGGVREL